MASAITVTRASGRDMGFAALVAVVFPLLVSLSMVKTQGYSVAYPWWMILNGAIVMPVSFFCLAMAPKYISGPEVAMFYLLETILAPVWVWMIFAEQPTRNTLIGGGIMVVTLIAHAIWQIGQERKRTRETAAHPA
ncbi:MAG: DMT family transporter, partial [Rhizobiaceae bacterium]|nr:DMT family transporter [Rhizobiaceae bacterium]